MIQYTYNGLGTRLARTENGVSKRFVIDPSSSLNQLLVESDSAGQPLAFYVYGLGLVSKLLPDGSYHYYHLDSRGSTIAVSDQEQNATLTYAYDPFGKELDSSDTDSDNPFRFLGEFGGYTESEALVFLRNRFYAPDMGRFLTRDPAGAAFDNTQLLNLYLYASNNPVTFIDPTGLSAIADNLSRSNARSSDVQHQILVDSRLREDLLNTLFLNFEAVKAGVFAAGFSGITLVKGPLEFANFISGSRIRPLAWTAEQLAKAQNEITVDMVRSLAASQEITLSPEETRRTAETVIDIVEIAKFLLTVGANVSNIGSLQNTIQVNQIVGTGNIPTYLKQGLEIVHVLRETFEAGNTGFRYLVPFLAR